MVAGRTSITPRALERVARGVAAGHLGVDASRVSVRLSDDKGMLALEVTAPLRSAPFTSASATGLVTRSELARQNISRDLTELGGAQVGVVALNINGIEFVEERRVS